MNTNKFIMVGATVGLFLGSFIPTFWGESEFSISSILFSTLGGAIGVWIAFKLTR
jgi:uncharacterized membrane protein YeaQ/YmgE (transglycosylase-associated protein family)